MDKLTVFTFIAAVVWNIIGVGSPKCSLRYHFRGRNTKTKRLFALCMTALTFVSGALAFSDDPIINTPNDLPVNIADDPVVNTSGGGEAVSSGQVAPKLTVIASAGKSGADVSAEGHNYSSGTSSSEDMERADSSVEARPKKSSGDSAGTSSRDQTQSNWFLSSEARCMPTWVMVGDDHVYIDEISLPYVFPSSGAVLNLTQGGLRVDLKGILLKPFAFISNVIDADGDLSIYLEDENVIEGRIDLSGGRGLLEPWPSSHRLLIFGPGKLTLLDEGNFSYSVISADDGISIMAGATVSIYSNDRVGLNSHYGDVLISGAMVGIYGLNDRAIECANLHILAGMMSVQTTHQGIYARENIIIDASIVNIFFIANLSKRRESVCEPFLCGLCGDGTG